MPTEITVALIGLAGSAVGSLVGIMVNTRLTTYRLEQLEKKVEAHNKLIERMYKLEGRADLLEGEIQAVEEKIDVLHKD